MELRREDPGEGVVMASAGKPRAGCLPLAVEVMGRLGAAGIGPGDLVRWAEHNAAVAGRSVAGPPRPS